LMLLPLSRQAILVLGVSENSQTRINCHLQNKEVLLGKYICGRGKSHLTSKFQLLSCSSRLLLSCIIGPAASQHLNYTYKAYVEQLMFSFIT
jgi:hypothetical protein